jgi:hypothetical protein
MLCVDSDSGAQKTKSAGKFGGFSGLVVGVVALHGVWVGWLGEEYAVFPNGFNPEIVKTRMRPREASQQSLALRGCLRQSTRALKALIRSLPERGIPVTSLGGS